MDRLTLLSMQGGLMLFLGTVILTTWRAQRREYSDSGAIWFSVGFILGGIGLLLQAKRGFIPPIYAIFIGNLLFVSVYPFVEKAMAITTHRRSYWPWLVAVIVALLCNVLYFTYITPNVIERTIVAVLVIPLLQAPICLHLLLCKEKTIRPALLSMVAVLLTHLALNLLRVVGILHLHQADVWFTWFGVVTIAGLALSFLWIDSLRLREELEVRAMTDPLTGLLNRRALVEFGNRELSRAARQNSPCSALSLDINNFKSINDTYGHAAGDQCLCAIAEALGRLLRTSDLPTRVGGDEFSILLPDSDARAAALISTRLKDAIQRLSLTTPSGVTFQFNISIGAATTRDRMTTLADLLHASDLKLYRDKHASRVETRPRRPDATRRQSDEVSNQSDLLRAYDY